MSKKKKNRRRRGRSCKPDSKEVLKEILQELRSIVRQREHLLRPINMFQTIESIPEDKPRHRVVFDTRPAKPIKGLMVGAKRIKLPDEKIIDDVLGYAKSVWHLKDRLGLWSTLRRSEFDIEEIINKSMELMVCSDLANRKKHGRSDNRSGFYPKLNVEVEFDTSKNGVLEFFYNGVLREKELLVTNRVPISYKVEILKENGNVLSNDAVEYISQAFNRVLPIVEHLEVLDQEISGGKELKLMLFCGGR